jgi:hypothetical protein
VRSPTREIADSIVGIVPSEGFRDLSRISHHDSFAPNPGEKSGQFAKPALAWEFGDEQGNELPRAV